MSDSEEKKKNEGSDEEEIKKDLDEILSRLSEKEEAQPAREASKKMIRPEEELEKITPKGTASESEQLEDLLGQISESSTEREAPQEELSIGQRIIGVFTNPERVFQYLARKPDIWVPLIISMLVGILVSGLVYDIALDDQIQRIEQNENIPDERKEMIIDSIESRRTGAWKIVSILVFPTIGVLMIFTLVSLVFWFIGNVIFGGKATFKQVFSAFGYAYLIYTILGTAVSLPLILTKKTLQIQLGLGNFLPDSMQESFLYHFLSRFDVFTLWTAVVFGIGFAVVYRFPRARGVITVLVVWLIYALVAAFLATRLSGFGA